MTASRTCPACGLDHLHSPKEARAIYQTSHWGADALLDDSTAVCSHCYAVRLPGGWDRLKSRREVAYELAQSSSNSDKDRDHYHDQIGPLPDAPDPSSDGPAVEPTQGEW